MKLECKYLIFLFLALTDINCHYIFLGTLAMMGLGLDLKMSLFLMIALTKYFVAPACWFWSDSTSIAKSGKKKSLLIIFLIQTQKIN